MASHSTDQHEPADQRSQCAEEFCNFFANEHTDGLCSQCYKNRMSRNLLSAEKASSSRDKAVGHYQADSVDVSAPTTSEPAEDLLAECSTASPSQPPADEQPEAPRKKNRCYMCKKKVGLMGFECKCGKLLCAAHRVAEEHMCDYDHKEAGRKRLAAENPLVSCVKIDRL